MQKIIDHLLVIGLINNLTTWIESAEKNGHHPNLKHVACSICQRIKQSKKLIKELEK